MRSLHKVRALQWDKESFVIDERFIFGRGDYCEEMPRRLSLHRCHTRSAEALILRSKPRESLRMNKHVPDLVGPPTVISGGFDKLALCQRGAARASIFRGSRKSSDKAAWGRTGGVDQTHASSCRWVTKAQGRGFLFFVFLKKITTAATVGSS